jgi:hypothetical protein
VLEAAKHMHKITPRSTPVSHSARRHRSANSISNHQPSSFLALTGADNLRGPTLLQELVHKAGFPVVDVRCRNSANLCTTSKKQTNTKQALTNDGNVAHVFQWVDRPGCGIEAAGRLGE